MDAVLMPFQKGGSILDFIEKTESWRDKEGIKHELRAAKVLVQMIEAVKVLEENSVVHRDIKN